MIGVPAWQAEENPVGILDGRDMAVVILNHFHRRAHLLRKEIHVNALRQPKGGVGVPEAIGAPASAGGARL